MVYFGHILFPGPSCSGLPVSPHKVGHFFYRRFEQIE